MRYEAQEVLDESAHDATRPDAVVDMDQPPPVVLSTIGIVYNTVLLIAFLALSAFFSASETALFSLSKVRLRRLQERDQRAKAIKQLLKTPTHLLSTIVFGNMLVNIGLSALATTLFVSWLGAEGFLAAVFLSGSLILFFGEIFPKTIAIYTADRLALLVAPPIKRLMRLLYPFTFIIERIVGRLSARFLRRGKRAGLSDDELRTALILSKSEGHISEHEEEMISYVLEFKETQASEIMTPRIDIKGLESKAGHKEAVTFLQKEKHSKFPVYEGSLDNIVGILSAKEVFLNPESDYHRFIREPLFVPESKRIDDLLKEFTEQRRRVAIVLDEYGGTEGMVTLEDVEEEIFGEIYDEFEVSCEVIEKLGKKRYRISGKAPVKTVNLELDLELPEEEDTLAGFLLSQIETIPRPNETFEHQGITFVIERATARRIVTVVVKLP